MLVSLRETAAYTIAIITIMVASVWTMRVEEQKYCDRLQEGAEICSVPYINSSRDCKAIYRELIQSNCKL